jgi:O-antigen/teichoic acid export membrane protein
MKTSLLKGSVIYAAATIISRVAVIILIPILTRIMATEEYGAMSLMTTGVQLANFIVTLEIAQAVTLYYTNQNDPNRHQYPPSALWFIVVVYAVLSVIAALLLGAGSSMNFSEAAFSPQLIFSGVILLAATGIFQLLQNQLRLEFKTKLYAILTILYVLLNAVGAIVGAKTFHESSAVGVIGGQALGTSISCAIAFFMLKKEFSFGFKMPALKKMISYSLPLVPASFFLIGTQQASKFILGAYGMIEQAGIFGLAMQIAGFSGLALIGVQTAITPAILANHQAADTPKRLGGLFEIFFTLSLLFCAGLSVFAEELIMIFSTPDYITASRYIPILAFGIAFNGLYIFFPGKIINGKSSAQLFASALSFIVSIIAALILVKTEGTMGAAIATLISSITFFCCWYFISQKLYHVPVKWLKLAMHAAIIIATTFIVVRLIPSSVSFSVIFLKSLILLVLMVVVGFRYISEGIKTYLARPKY